MTTYKRGDVILVRFPNSDLVTYKKRPALVVQDENIDTDLNQRLVAMITSNLMRVGETRVLVRKDTPAGQAMGLITDSVSATPYDLLWMTHPSAPPRSVPPHSETTHDESHRTTLRPCSRIAPINSASRGGTRNAV